MIDQFNDDSTSWARFSDDEVMRYHLVRAVSPAAQADRELMPVLSRTLIDSFVATSSYDVTTFLLCNPSTATAFKPDPTVGECVKFTRRWDSDIAWVVNLWAYRSPYPADLKKRACGSRGDDAVNNQAILLACSAATRIIAAFGNDGALDGRGSKVVSMLATHGYDLQCMGVTGCGAPKHPLARGKHRIPADQQPFAWAP